MFRKFTKMLLICTLAVLSVCGCGSDGESSSNSGDNKYGISIGGVTMKTNYEGQPYIVVEVSFTNTEEKATHFNLIGHTKVYQNGVECSQIPMDIGDEEGIAECMRNIQPGQSYTVHPAFYLNDLTSDIEVIVNDFLELNEYASKVISIQEEENEAGDSAGDGAGNSTGNEAGNSAANEAGNNGLPTEINSEELYGELLYQYYTMLKNGVTADKFQEKTGSDLIFNYNMNLDLDSIGYALLDIDGNGIDELFIGCVQGGALTLEGTVTHGIFINAYGINTEENMIEPIACSNRSLYYYLCTDGLVGEYESHIPFTETYAFFELYGETGLYSASGVIIFDNEEGWYVVTEGNKEVLTSAEADSLINSHIPMQINFTPFSRFQY